MFKIGLIRERKIPSDSRVALTPEQCKWLNNSDLGIEVVVESSPDRCYTDAEYLQAGIKVIDHITDCDLFLGIKEVPKENVQPDKHYMFFSHTKKLQAHNQGLMQEMVKKRVTLTDYECLEHADSTRIIGFGFFAGIVGAHNGMMAWGKRTGAFDLCRVFEQQNLQDLIHTYFGLKIPPVKIAVTGSGRVAHGIIEVMSLMEIKEVEVDEYLSKTFEYPVYVHLKPGDLYIQKNGEKYKREIFHAEPQKFDCLFYQYFPHTDILMNGVYWEQGIPRLFEKEHVNQPDFKITTIADITDDENGSVPINIGDSTIQDPVYGISKKDLTKTLPYIQGSIDMMAVGNLPNELPRDASRYFGEQLIKFVLPDFNNPENEIVKRATILKKGSLTEPYSYMQGYAAI